MLLKTKEYIYCKCGKRFKTMQEYTNHFIVKKPLLRGGDRIQYDADGKVMEGQANIREDVLTEYTIEHQIVQVKKEEFKEWED